MIVASISLDGGRTFLNTVRVNNDEGDCGGGQQDQEHAVFDFGTSPPTLWVVWRHRGQNTYGGCVRGGTISTDDPSSPTIDWLGPALTVDNMTRDDELSGQGGLLIAARTVDTEQGPFTRISVMYSNDGSAPEDCDGDPSLAWETVTSDNLGVDWYDSVRITDSKDFNWCAASEQIRLGYREFWFVQDPFTGTYWAAVNESPSQIGVFVSPDWGATWTRHETFVEPGRNAFQPTIAVDFSGRIALNYWRDDSTNVQRMGVGNGIGSGPTWGTPIALTPLFPAGPGQSFAGGDYQSLIGIPDGVIPGGTTFFGAWSQEEFVETMPQTVVP